MTTGRRGRKAWRVAAKLLLIGAVLYVVLFVAFPAWQLRYTYRTAVTFAPHSVPSPFYRPSLLKRHKVTVREWATKEFPDYRRSSFLCYCNLLALTLGEREDLEVLLSKTGEKYWPGPSEWDKFSMAFQLTILVGHTYGICQGLTDSRAEALDMLASACEGRPMAPAVLSAYDNLFRSEVHWLLHPDGEASLSGYEGPDAMRAGRTRLAKLLIRAVRENDAGVLENDILTGTERFAWDLQTPYGKPPLSSREVADRVNREVFAEVASVVHDLHREVLRRGVDPHELEFVNCHESAACQVGSFTEAKFTAPGAKTLWIFFSYATFVRPDLQRTTLLDGGGILGGITYAWLTDEEHNSIPLPDGRTAPVDRLNETLGHVVRNKLNYRWVVQSRCLPRPDALRIRGVDLTYRRKDGYIAMTREQKTSLRRVITYSEWPKPNEKGRGRRLSGIEFDKHGNAVRVLPGDEPTEP
jgi:hypothetical protein